MEKTKNVSWAWEHFHVVHRNTRTYSRSLLRIGLGVALCRRRVVTKVHHGVRAPVVPLPEKIDDQYPPGTGLTVLALLIPLIFHE